MSMCGSTKALAGKVHQPYPREKAILVILILGLGSRKLQTSYRANLSHIVHTSQGRQHSQFIHDTESEQLRLDHELSIIACPCVLPEQGILKP